jgi:membrane-associated progesterone receptor component
LNRQISIHTFDFVEKYDLVGKLLKPGEQPTNYSDEEDEPGSSDKSGGEEKVDEKAEDTKPEE